MKTVNVNVSFTVPAWMDLDQIAVFIEYVRNSIHVILKSPDKFNAGRGTVTMEAIRTIPLGILEKQ